MVSEKRTKLQTADTSAARARQCIDCRDALHHVLLHRGCCTHMLSVCKHLRAALSANRKVLQVGHDAKLIDWLRQRYHDNPDPVYGGGFRRAVNAFQAIGLKQLLQHVAQHGTLPEYTPAYSTQRVLAGAAAQ